MFTIGQHKGLPGGSPRPMYVVVIDPELSCVIVGTHEELTSEEFVVDNLNWLIDEPFEPIDVTIKIRHAHPGAEPTVSRVEANRHLVRLHEPQRAVTPGQAAVFYEGPAWLVGDGSAARQQL